jgi:hypothetical protein
MENLGKSYAMNYKSPQRIILVNTYDNSGAVNRILKSAVTGIAALKAKFNVYWHSADPTTKWVPTPRCAAVTPTYNQPTAWELEWYKTWMQAGTLDMAFTLPDVSPNIIDSLTTIASDGIPKSFFMVSGDQYLLGKDDDTYITPFQIQDNSILVPPNNLRAWDKGAENIISFRLTDSTDMNKLIGILVADGYPALDSSYYSLIDVTCTPTSPTANGVVLAFALTNKNPLAPGTAIPLTDILHSEVLFTHATEADVSIATAGNWVETPDGTYTLTQSAAFAAGAWTVQVSHPGYEVAEVSFTVTI